MKRQRSTPLTKPITPTGYQFVYATSDKQIAEVNSQGKHQIYTQKINIIILPNIVSMSVNIYQLLSHRLEYTLQ